MAWLIFKYLVTAGVVVTVSEVAKRSERIGGLIAALPLVTVLALIWLHVERQPQESIANHAWYTFWYAGRQRAADRCLLRPVRAVLAALRDRIALNSKHA
jgi:hypothetical protein